MVICITFDGSRETGPECSFPPCKCARADRWTRDLLISSKLVNGRNSVISIMFSDFISDQEIIGNEDRPVAVTSRVVQDRRNISRVSTRFTCHFTHEGVSREAVVIDLSFTGALLSSKSMPPIGSHVSVTLKPPAVKETIKLDAKVIRGGWGLSDHGTIGKFGIRFLQNRPQLMPLITKLK